MQVFADDESSKNPIHVPREWLWHLERRTAYFASSTSALFRGKQALQKRELYNIWVKLMS
jgi:hypothetical protein